MNDIRWKQRFENFEKGLKLLNEAVALKKPSLLEQEGTIQRFEFTFELAWKTMTDYLREEGIPVSSPREAIKKSFESELIQDGDTWMEMLKARNETVHVYDEEKFHAVLNEIAYTYLPLLNRFQQNLISRL